MNTATEKKLKYAGGHNSGRYSVAGYEISPDHYFVKSVNSITAEIAPAQPRELKKHLTDFTVSLFRNNKFILSYAFNLNMNITFHTHSCAIVDNIALNILFQLDDYELDIFLPMIQTGTNHSFSFDHKIEHYYVLCDNNNPCLDEFIIRKFADKFYFDECSLYRKNMSMHKMLNEHSHFKIANLFHSLSNNDSYLELSGHHATWFLYYNCEKNMIEAMMRHKNSKTLEDLYTDKAIPVVNVDDFYETAFKMIVDHILSPDYITTGMHKIVEAYNMDISLHWTDFLKLYDMATI